MGKTSGPKIRIFDRDEIKKVSISKNWRNNQHLKRLKAEVFYLMLLKKFMCGNFGKKIPGI